MRVLLLRPLYVHELRFCAPPLRIKIIRVIGSPHEIVQEHNETSSNVFLSWSDLTDWLKECRISIAKLLPFDVDVWASE